jgi:hypothetical protein
MKTAHPKLLIVGLLFFCQLPYVATYAEPKDSNPSPQTETQLDEVNTTTTHSAADTSLGEAAKNAGAGGAAVGAVDPNTSFAQNQQHTVETRAGALPIALGVIALIIVGTIAYSVNNRRKQGLDPKARA